MGELIGLCLALSDELLPLLELGVGGFDLFGDVGLGELLREWERGGGGWLFVFALVDVVVSLPVFLFLGLRVGLY